MMTDKIADLITRIRNGLRVNHEFVLVKNRKLTIALLDLLQKEGYISGYEPTENNNLKVILKYVDHRPAIKVIERISKPGCPKYVAIKDFKPYFNGLGINVLSTSKGIMSDYQAKEENVGGELLFMVF